MSSDLIIPANVAKNLVQVINTYFTEETGSPVDRLEILEAIERTMHDLLIEAGGERIVEEYEWLNPNPFYVPLKGA
jgi:hypothetical protein